MSKSRKIRPGNVPFEVKDNPQRGGTKKTAAELTTFLLMLKGGRKRENMEKSIRQCPAPCFNAHQKEVSGR